MEWSFRHGFTGHSGRVGSVWILPQTSRFHWTSSRESDQSAGVELPALMTAGRWKSAKIPARYTER